MWSLARSGPIVLLLCCRPASESGSIVLRSVLRLWLMRLWLPKASSAWLALSAARASVSFRTLSRETGRPTGVPAIRPRSVKLGTNTMALAEAEREPKQRRRSPAVPELAGAT